MNERSLLEGLDADDQELVTRFFGEFAMAEFRLKSLGYIKRGRQDAQADWELYAAGIRGLFGEHRRNDQLAKAWETLTDDPPRKQVVTDGRLAWRPTDRARDQSDEDYALLLVRRVRNNLFHGAKFLLTGSRNRDRELVSAALTLLREALAHATPCSRGRRRHA